MTMLIKAMTRLERQDAGSPAKDYGYSRATPAIPRCPTRTSRRLAAIVVLSGTEPLAVANIYWMVYCACPIVTLNCRMEGMSA
jgi:hypothetical protein